MAFDDVCTAGVKPLHSITILSHWIFTDILPLALSTRVGIKHLAAVLSPPFRATRSTYLELRQHSKRFVSLLLHLRLRFI